MAEKKNNPNGIPKYSNFYGDFICYGNVFITKRKNYTYLLTTKKYLNPDDTFLKKVLESGIRRFMKF